jgi:hypothetical protein
LDFPAQTTIDFIQADIDELKAGSGNPWPPSPFIFINGYPVVPVDKFQNVLDYLFDYTDRK